MVRFLISQSVSDIWFDIGIKVCLEILSVLSFFTIVWWVFLNIFCFNHVYFWVISKLEFFYKPDFISFIRCCLWVCNDTKAVKKLYILINPSSTNPTKWSNTLKQFVANLPREFNFNLSGKLGGYQGISFHKLAGNPHISQLTFTCSKSTMETEEKSAKYVPS